MRAEAIEADPHGEEGSLELVAHAERVGGALRGALEQLVLAICGPTPRPSQLISRLGMDKTLAGRMIQTVRAKGALTALSRCPTPLGLEIFVRAAQSAGAPVESISRVREAIAGFERLLARFPRGRSGLDAAISGWLPETREQGERAARQAAFKAMSFILGYQSDITLGCTFLKPGADGETVDVAYVSGQFGLRRLRVGEPLSVFGTRYYPLKGSGTTNPSPTTLDGRSIEDASYLLEEFSGPGTPRLEIVRAGDQRLFVLPADEPGLNEPISVVVGHMTRGSWRRFASEDQREEWQTMLARCPTRVFINDTFMRDDVYPGVEPVVTTNIVGMSPLPARERGSGFPLDEVHLSRETGWVRGSVSDIGTGEIPRHPELIASVFRRQGEDPGRYRVHRLRMSYPVASIVATRWFRLPERPA